MHAPPLSEVHLVRDVRELAGVRYWFADVRFGGGNRADRT